MDECTEGMDNCDPVATCTDLLQGFECTCPAGYDDINNDGTLCIGMLHSILFFWIPEVQFLFVAQNPFI